MAGSLLQRLHEGQRELHDDLQRYIRPQNTLLSRNTQQAPNNSTVDDPAQQFSRCYKTLDQRLNESRRAWKTPRKPSGEEQTCPGYDWVAGLLDNNNTSISQYSTEWLQELKEFRQVNHSECYMPSSHDNHMMSLRSPGVTPNNKHQTDKPDYIHSYAMNDRLFPIPINCTCDKREGGEGETKCPVCENLLHPNTSHQAPSLIQVSVPHDILQVPYQARPHRRVSFNPSDSMGLSQHCLSGWKQNSKIASFSNCKNISLKSSLKQSENNLRTN